MIAYSDAIRVAIRIVFALGVLVGLLAGVLAWRFGPRVMTTTKARLSVLDGSL